MNTARDISKKTLSIIVSIAMVLLCLPSIALVAPATAHADETIVASGTCGEAANWELNSSGHLTISGQGAVDKPQSLEKYKADVVSIEVQEGITSLENETFRGFTKLATAHLPESLQSIGGYGFYNCFELTNITLPAALKSIGASAFRYCSNIKKITFPASLEVIGNSAFNSCTNLETIDIPGSTTIEPCAFGDCRSLERATINSGVKTIPNGCFSCCIKLEEVKLPDGIETIGDGAFLYCTSLAEMNFPLSLESVGEYAFDCGAYKYCPVLRPYSGFYSEDKVGNQTVLLLATGELLILGKGTFSALERTRYWLGVRTTSVRFGPGITIIGGDGCFLYGPSFPEVKSVSIPNTVIEIADNSFTDFTTLETITIPSSVTQIGSSAFKGLTNLKEIHVSSKTAYDQALAACPSNCTVIWPDKPPTPTMSFASNNFEVTYGTSATNALTYTGNGEVTYYSSNSAVATVAADGTITPVKAGTCTITASAPETASYEAANASYTLTVTRASQTISLPTSSAELVGNETLSLATAAKTAVTYESSNTRVATVDSDGTVEACGLGSCTITATAAQTPQYEQATATCDITVIARGSKEATMSFASSQLTATYGKQTNNALKYTGDGKVSYYSTNTGIATVAADGTITPVAAGTCTITASAPSTNKYKEATASYTLEVKRAAQTVTLSQNTIALKRNKTTQLAATAKTDISYTSSDESVATVSASGLITARKAGTCTITASAKQTSQYEAAASTCTITVEKTAPTLAFVHSKITASAIDIPENPLTCSSDAEPTYSSLNSTVAKVDPSTGKLTLVGTGTCTITAKTAETQDSTAAAVSYELTVIKAPSNLAFKGDFTVRQGGTYSIFAKSASTGTITYISSDTSIATVSKSGYVKAIRPGSVTITATIAETPLFNSSVANTNVTITKSRSSIAKVKKPSVTPISYKGNYGFKISFKKVSNATGYALQASTSKSFKKAKSIKKKTSYFKKQRKLLGYDYGWKLAKKKGKTYYIRVRAYKVVSGKTVYGEWSTAVKKRTR